MRKLTLFIASLLVSVASFAQWTKPAAPAVTPMAVGEECYLYNRDADGFLVGANDWGTRASFSPTLGHKVYIENGTAEGSYYISNYVLEGGMANQIGYMFIDDLNAIWVDNTKDGKTNNQYTLEAQGDGTYKIGLSPMNAEYNPVNYPGAYLGVIPAKDDTRLYFCDPENSEGYSMEDCQIVWYFVAPADYATYSSAMAQYLAAVALGESIAQADALDNVDAAVLAAAKNAYGNTGSSLEVLEAQKSALDVAIFQALLFVATVENPVEALKLQGIATDFNDSDFTGWTSTTSASNKQASNGNNAKDFSVTGNHYENWNWDAFSIGKVSATATNLPSGVYHLNALAYTTTVGGTYLYAGESQKLVTTTQIDIDNPMDIYTIVNDGQLEIGLDVQKKGTNWIGLDNVGLYFMGRSFAAWEVVRDETIASEPDYEAQLENDEIACQRSVFDAYKAAKEGLSEVYAYELTGTPGEAGFDIELAKTKLGAFAVASKAMVESVKAYQVYKEKFDEAEVWLNSTTSESEEVNMLADYLMDDTEAAGEYNGHGGAPYILAEGLLDAEQIVAEAAYLERILKDAMANAMSDGDDCTSMLKNPRFAEEGGWQGVTNTSITWPTGNTEVYPVMQANNVACNIYQELTGLQNGLYEFNLQAAFRPGETYTEENEAIATAYAYINSYETKIPSGNIEGVVTLNESDEASTAFAEGQFPVTVYGLVTDGTMRLGVTNKVRTVENCRLWAGGATLTFRGKNAEVLAQVIGQTVPEAQNLLENYAGAPELNALSDAIANAQDAEDAYAGLVALKAAMEAVETGTTLYANFAVALKTLSDAINTSTNASASTINKAKELLATAQDAYDKKSYNNAEVEQAISDLNAMSVAVKIGGGSASEDNPEDYTSAIVNNDFDPARGDKNTSTIEGWTTTTLNGYKEHTASYNKNTFSLSQTLSGLPKGKYKLTVHAFYRAGSYEEEEANINNGVDTHLAKFYANTSVDKFEKPVMNLSEGGVTNASDVPEGVNTRTINGIYVPDGTSASVAFYKAGYYLNELEFFVGEDGTATIGMHLDQTIGSNDYVVVGEWKLWYMGDPDAGVTEQDVSNLIVNNDFDPARGDKNTSTIEGWTTTTLNGYKEHTASYNKNTFSLSQSLSGLPKGKYRLTVHAFYRAGSYEEEEANINNGVDTHLAKFYANTLLGLFEKPVMNLSEGGVTNASDVPEGVNTRTINGIYVPDGTSASVAFYKAGYYLNELEFMVGEDGAATIGMHLDQTIGSNDYVVVGEWKLWYLGDTSVNEQDVTSLIVNNDFDPARGDKNTSTIEGWTTTTLNGYKEHTASYNKNTFSLSQSLSGLPEGTYKVTVHAFYRAGSYEEEAANINNGVDTHLAILYATTSEDTYSKPVMNLSEGGVSSESEVPEGAKTSTINGIYVPDGTSASVAFYNAGYYLNELPFYVGTDGKATIGIHLDQTIGSNDYVVVGEWKLYYYGSGKNADILGGDEPVGIEQLDTVSEGMPAGIYSISGTRLTAPQRGVNIVKMADGRVLKVLVK